ncbi:hypothetical protein [Micromonospora sp. NPDC093277]|uniref:hypothetical protein n=1 Tax=Micromonospora sp. NPDC093277 TaxID=3364291 RepID=UPI0038085BD4
MSSEQVLEALAAHRTSARGAGLVSVHEHVGSELLYQDNPGRHLYRQDLTELAGVLDGARQALEVGDARTAVLTLPMPFYRTFKPACTRTDPATAVAESDARNDALIAACAGWRRADVSPLVALLADPARPAKLFTERYALWLPAVSALKWHPPAAGTPVVEYVRGGYLDLAAELEVPLIVHCSPAGRLGDLDEILRDLLPEADRLGVRVSIAHAAFLNAAVSRVAEYPSAYLEVSPWEVIRQRTVGDVPEPPDELLIRLLRQHPGRVVFSLDTPWHRQPWDDGRVLGVEVAATCARLRASAEAAGVALDEVIRVNPGRLLWGGW